MKKILLNGSTKIIKKLFLAMNVKNKFCQKIIKIINKSFVKNKIMLIVLSVLKLTVVKNNFDFKN